MVWFEASGPVDADAIVLVHGSLDRSAGLLRLSRRLSDRFRVIRYDRRGYGRSAALPGPFTVAAHVEDLDQLLETATEGRGARLAFGHSFGGNIVLALAQRRPELIERAAIYETPLSWMPWWPDNTAGGAALGSADGADAAEAFMRRLVGDAKWERLPRATRAARRAEGVAMVEELADLRREAPWRGDHLALPVLVMSGERAHPQHEEGAAAMPGLVPGCRLVTIAGAGHVGPNTHADAVAAALVDFLGASDRGGADPLSASQGHAG